jgi:electron transfer flavoprotein alpha subunit
MLGIAADLAYEWRGSVVAVVSNDTAVNPQLTSWGADTVLEIAGDDLDIADVARATADWMRSENLAQAVVGPSTTWGRELAARLSARLGAGLTGDAIRLETQGKSLIAWKPAFGGQLQAAISYAHSVQLATIRPGMMALREPRPPHAIDRVEWPAAPRRRVRTHNIERNDDLLTLVRARVIIAVGAGIDPGNYHLLEPLAALLGAELAATRKVTDAGWLPHSRQVGITGRSVQPALYLALGISGKLNHTIGARGAHTIVAINNDAKAPIFDAADVGVVADWRDVITRVTSIFQDSYRLAAAEGRG